MSCNGNVWVAKDGKIHMSKCPKCNLENYYSAVRHGQCAWCGYEAKMEDVMNQQVDVESVATVGGDDKQGKPVTASAPANEGGGSIGSSGGEQTAAVASPVTIETINGKRYTVVWHDGIARSESYMVGFWCEAPVGYVALHGECTSYVFATALPALPRHPKPEDVRLLHLYAAHGVIVHGLKASLNDYRGVTGSFPDRLAKITHATDSEGNRIEIAIEGDV